MLHVRGLIAAYGASRVLHGVDLDIMPGEVVTLMGRNGMGKTTTVGSIFGLLRPRAGSVTITGREMAGAAPHLIARAGLGLVPEGRQVFRTLTVEENLIATARPGRPPPLEAEARVREFPRFRGGGPTWATSFRVASSRCWPSDARC